MRRSRRLPQAVREALDELKKAFVAIYGDRLRGIYLYGSYARGDFSDASDVDLLVTLSGEVNPYREISRASEIVSDISLRYDLLIATYPVPVDWLWERRSPLFENVRREGVLV